MKYDQVELGTFVRRINRFTACVKLRGEERTVHVKNTARLLGLLVPGAEVSLEPAKEPGRKTSHSLIGVRRTSGGWANIDAWAPNAIACEAIAAGRLRELTPPELLRREVVYGKSRFDLYAEWRNGEKAFIEVKGVTQERDGLALFPDAPTERGAKHVRELAEAVKDGYAAYVLFIVKMRGMTGFAPNGDIDPAFARALAEARDRGVRVLAYDCIVGPDECILGQPLAIRLP